MKTTLRLSPVDHIFTGRGGYPISFLFFFSERLDEARLRTSLEETLAVYWPCSSRFVAQGNKSLGLDKGAETYHWNVRTVAADLLNEDISRLGDFISTAKSVVGETPLHVTLTHTAKNGVKRSCLGVSISHAVVDGYSYFMFLAAWSKTLRGLASTPPNLDRSVLIPTEVPVGQPLDSETVFKNAGYAFVEERRPGDFSKVTWETLDFTKTEVDALYASATQGREVRLSVNDVLSAEVWKRFALKNQSPGQTLAFSCAYDYRRVYSKIDGTYFGNAILGASLKKDFNEMQAMKTGDLAEEISRAVRSVTEDSVALSLTTLESVRNELGLDAMERFHVADPKTGFLLTNLSRLPILDLDFGVGPPVDFRILTPARRTAVILPLKDGLRVQLAL